LQVTISSQQQENLVILENKPLSRHWWESPYLVCTVIFASALPLVWPDIPPLADLPGHMSRYYLALNIDESTALQRWFRFDWVLFGNLGVDLIVMPLGALFGVEIGTKIIVAAIPPLAVWGYILVAREVHGHIPPTAYFAAPFAFSYPFQFGFVNFSIATALAFIAFSLWLRMEANRYRSIVFLCISVILWLAHVYGWVVLCILIFSSEIGSKRNIQSLLIRCASLVSPFIIMIWQAITTQSSTPLFQDWFNILPKFVFFFSPLRDHWFIWDFGAIFFLIGIYIVMLRTQSFIVDKGMAIAAFIFLGIFILMPRVAMGSVLADMRLVPFIFICAFLALRVDNNKPMVIPGAIALLAIGFAFIRLIGTVYSYFLYDEEFDRELAAISAIPQNAAMIAMVGDGHQAEWRLPRKGHIPSFAIIRKQAFSNDQYVIPSQQALRVIRTPAPNFDRDPSQYAFDVKTMTQQLSKIAIGPGKVDTIWIIDDPRGPPPVPAGMRSAWRSGSSAVFVIDKEPLEKP
jgi:hypothetical protein